MSLQLLESDAIEKVEEVYGSVEEFASLILTAYPSALEDDVGLEKLSFELSLPMEVVSRVLASTSFRRVVTGALARRRFSLSKQAKHTDLVIDRATEGKKTVLTRQGDAKEVDTPTKDIIEAGRYLHELMDAPISGAPKGISGGINIIFGSGEAGKVEVEEDGKTITVEGGQRPDGYKPARAGGLPPEGARRYYETPATAKGGSTATKAGGELDFTGQAAASEEAPQTISPSERKRQELARAAQSVPGKLPSLP